MQSRRRFLGTLATAATLPATFGATTARAQSIPRLVTVTVGYPAGGGTDVIARLVSEGLRGTYGENVVVETRDGAGGRIAAERVKNAPADGTSLLFTPAFPMAIYPHIYKKMPYDTLRDFVPVALSHRGVLALSVGPAVPDSVKTLADFIAWARANPDKSDFGAPTGSAQHFAGALFARSAGIDFRLIGYKGGAPSITDMLGGHIAAVVTALSEVMPFLASGKLRILATTASARSVAAPTIPTMTELGYPDVLFQDWCGFLAPAGTPADVVARANAAITKVVSSAKVSSTIVSLGLSPATSTQAAFAAEVKTSWQRYGEIVKSTGFTADE